MIRAVIFTLLALSVRAANYGHSSYLSGIPSYSSSGLFGSLYGSGLTYGHGLSGLHYGSGLGGLHYGSGHGGLHYGSGHSGLHYGSGHSGLHYGSGHNLGYGSGLHYTSGLHGGHLTSAIRPSIYSSRYPSGAVLNGGQAIVNVPGRMEFIMGGAGQKAQIGAIAGQSPVLKYTPRVPYSSGAMLNSGFIANEGPAKIEFVLGGAGYKTGAAALEGHGKPAIHKSSQAIRRIDQAPRYGMPITDPAGAAHITFNQDFSGVPGMSGVIGGAPRRQNINLNKAAGFLTRPAIVGSQKSGLRTAGGLAHSSAPGQAGVSPVQPAINALTGGSIAQKYTPRVPYSSGAMLRRGYFSNEAPAKINFVLGGTGFQTGAASLDGYGKPAAIHPAGIYSAGVGPSAISASRPAIRPIPKVSSPIAGAALTRIQSRNAAGIHGGAAAGAGHSQISFNQGYSRIGGRSHAGIKPETSRLSAPVEGTAAHHGSGIDAVSLHSTGIGGISAIGGHENIISAHDIAGVSGLHSSGVLPAAPALASAGGAIRPSTGNVRRANMIRKIGAQGINSAAGPHMSFNMGQSALRKPGTNVAITPAVATSHGSGIDAASLHNAGIGGISAIGGGHENILFSHDIAGLSGLHSSGLIPVAPALTTGGAIKPSTHNVHQSNLIRKSGAHGLTSGVTGPHISFNLGETALRKPGMNVASLEKIIAPAVAPRPISSSGIRGLSASIPAYGSSGVAGPAGISFIQDFSKVTGSQIAGVQPLLSISDKLSAPIIPSAPRIQGALRNTAGFISSSIAKPVPGALAYRAPKLPGSISSSLAGSTSQGGSALVSGPAVNAAEGHATDFKQGVAGLSGQLASFGIAPESGVAHFDKSAISTHSTAGAAISSGIVSGVQHSSAGIRSGSLRGSSGSLGAVSGDKASIFVDGALGDKSTILFHSTGVSGGSNLLGDQGSIIELAPAGINTALYGQGMSRSVVLPAFPSFPASSHSGFSHVLREPARDKSLFYTAGSPSIVSSVSTSDIIRK